MIKGEPKLEELLSEPMVLMRAKSAGMSAEQLRDLCQRMKARLARERATSAPRR
jgi:hypothetical protein